MVAYPGSFRGAPLASQVFAKKSILFGKGWERNRLRILSKFLIQVAKPEV